jgi:predicted site-specific integrase-resolvase
MPNNNLGPLLTLGDAADRAGISKATIYNYVNLGYLEVHFEGGMVYYRDLLRASWEAKQNQMKNGSTRAYGRGS